jgi:hypothetical protein
MRLPADLQLLLLFDPRENLDAISQALRDCPSGCDIYSYNNESAYDNESHKSPDESTTSGFAPLRSLDFMLSLLLAVSERRLSQTVNTDNGSQAAIEALLAGADKRARAVRKEMKGLHNTHKLGSSNSSSTTSVEPQGILVRDDNANTFTETDCFLSLTALGGEGEPNSYNTVANEADLDREADCSEMLIQSPLLKDVDPNCFRSDSQRDPRSKLCQGGWHLCAPVIPGMCPDSKLLLVGEVMEEFFPDKNSSDAVTILPASSSDAVNTNNNSRLRAALKPFARCVWVLGLLEWGHRVPFSEVEQLLLERCCAENRE